MVALNWIKMIFSHFSPLLSLAGTGTIQIISCLDQAAVFKLNLEKKGLHENCVPYYD